MWSSVIASSMRYNFVAIISSLELLWHWWIGDAMRWDKNNWTLVLFHRIWVVTKWWLIPSWNRRRSTRETRSTTTTTSTAAGGRRRRRVFTCRRSSASSASDDRRRRRRRRNRVWWRRRWRRRSNCSTKASASHRASLQFLRATFRLKLVQFENVVASNTERICWISLHPPSKRELGNWNDPLFLLMDPLRNRLERSVRPDSLDQRPNVGRLELESSRTDSTVDGGGIGHSPVLVRRLRQNTVLVTSTTSTTRTVYSTLKLVPDIPLLLQCLPAPYIVCP